MPHHHATHDVENDCGLAVAGDAGYHGQVTGPQPVMRLQSGKPAVERHDFGQRRQFAHAIEPVDLHPLRPVDRLGDAALAEVLQYVGEVLAGARVLDPLAARPAEAQREVIQQSNAGGIAVNRQNDLLAVSRIAASLPAAAR